MKELSMLASAVAKENLDQTVSANPSNGEDNERLPLSSEIIREQFVNSSSLITIFGSRVIIAKDEKAGQKQFGELIDELSKSEKKVGVGDRQDRLMAWILDAGYQQKLGTRALDWAWLRSSLEALPKPLRDWLQPRASFFVADADPSWIEISSATKTIPTRNYGISASRNARKLFKTFSGEHWSGWEAYTAGVGRHQRHQPTLFSHKSPKPTAWSKGAVGEKRRSISPTRNDLIREFDLAQHNLFSGIPVSSKGGPVSNLFRKGFLTFTFEEFLRLPINYN